MKDTAATKTPATVLSELVDWSEGLPLWQRDALRRLYESCSLTQTDKAELLTLCKHSAGLLPAEAKIPTVTPLSKDHIPSGEGTTETVTVASVRDVKQVNALIPGQSLSFRENGLTVIYGNNGAGKSGYSRILKKVCRARAGEAILSNIYESQKEPPTATLGYSINGKPESCTWNDANAAPLVLSRISLFDGKCAPIHVDEEYEAAYMPVPLQILQNLATVCKEFERS